jgi:hypothetical protein
MIDECCGTNRRENPTWVAASAREGSRSTVAVRSPLIDTLRRRRARSCKEPHLRSAREEAGGKPRSRRRLAHLGREKPKGASGVRQANHQPIARDSAAGKNPGAAARRAGPPLRAGRLLTGKTASGCDRVETLRSPRRRKTLRRANPTSAAGVKKSRPGFGGRKPRRG